MATCIKNCIKLIIAYYVLNRFAKRIGDDVKEEKEKEEDRKQIQGTRGIRKGRSLVGKTGTSASTT